MAAPSKIKRPVIVDKWSTRETLALGCSVLRSGDQNWVSVSRAIRPFAEKDRHADWFSQKNCAIQYSTLLEKVDTQKRKRGDATPVETPGTQIVRKLTIERIEELKRLVQEEEQQYLALSKELDMIQACEDEEKLLELYSEMKKRQNLEGTQNDSQTSTSDSIKEQLTDTPVEDKTKEKPKLKIDIPPQRQAQAHTSPAHVVFEGDQVQQVHVQKAQTPVPKVKLENMTPDIQLSGSASSLCSSSSDMHTALAHAKHLAEITPTSPSQVAPTLSRLLGTPSPAVAKPPGTTLQHYPSIPTTGTPNVQPLTVSSDSGTKPALLTLKAEEKPLVLKPLQIPNKEPSPTSEPVDTEMEADQTEVIAGEEPLSKDDPVSPTSSVSSRVSETGSSVRKKRRGRGQSLSLPKSGRRSQRLTKKEDVDKKEEGGSKQSDFESSDAETIALESDDLATPSSRGMTQGSFMDSIPNSPASLSQCSDTEDEKAHKAWKKSILIVWRHAATHKFANVFAHHVTDDIAPGYSSVVYRPMNLTTVKKNVELGVTRTTAEFRRDMMLMFTNAIMYNSSDHDVFKMAEDMYDDTMKYIEEFANTQLMVQPIDVKSLRASRRSDTDKDEEGHKRRTSTEQETGGKTKKRKTRADD